MPELIRSVVSRVRVFFSDRRQSPRLRTRLQFSISVPRKAKTMGGVSSDQVLKGHTRDISVSGVAMMLPQVHFGGHHLAAERRELHLRLELPTGPMDMVVAPRRYEKLDDSELGCSYLIGARIVQIADTDRKLLEKFIADGLGKRASVAETESFEN